MRHPVIIVADSPGALTELCGISLVERLLRTLQRLDLTKAIVLSNRPELLARHLAHPSCHRTSIAIDLRRRASEPMDATQVREVWPDEAKTIMVIQGDNVFDSRLVQLLDHQSRTVVLVDSAPPPGLQPLVASSPNTLLGRFCGAAILSQDWVKSHDGPLEPTLLEEIEAGELEVVDIGGGDWHHAAMRRRLHPTWFPLPIPEHGHIARRVLIKAAQKGSVDLPAMVHAPIENFLINHLCRTAITPNQLTALTNILAWGATFLFARGRLGWGAVLALAVGILDGLDGKQARVKIETSKIGKLEHWFDAFFEHSWWIAIAYSLQDSGRLPGAFIYLVILMGAEAVAGLARLSVIRMCGRTLDELGDFNRIVRLIGGRRNVYVWLFAFGLLLQAPGQAFALMATWAAATACVQVLRASVAVWTQRMGRMPTEVPAEA